MANLAKSLNSVRFQSIWVLFDLVMDIHTLAYERDFFCLFIFNKLFISLLICTRYYAIYRLIHTWKEMASFFWNFYMTIGKAVWIFEASSNVEADSTEQLDSQKHESLWHGFTSWYFSFVIMWTCVLLLAEFQWLQGYLQSSQKYRVVYMCAYSYIYACVY